MLTLASSPVPAADGNQWIWVLMSSYPPPSSHLPSLRLSHSPVLPVSDPLWRTGRPLFKRPSHYYVQLLSSLKKIYFALFDWSHFKSLLGVPGPRDAKTKPTIMAREPSGSLLPLYGMPCPEAARRPTPSTPSVQNWKLFFFMSLNIWIVCVCWCVNVCLLFCFWAVNVQILAWRFLIHATSFSHSFIFR